MTEPIDWNLLTAAAREAQTHAHAPYSDFPVGAALLCDDDRVFVGANVENASHGLTTCAERNAVAAAVSAGARRFRALVVVGPTPTPPSPCGACRQVLHEFPPSFEVRAYGRDGAELRETTASLLPNAFTLRRAK